VRSQPGAYQLASVATVLNALCAGGGLADLVRMAGGFRANALLRRVAVYSDSPSERPATWAHAASRDRRTAATTDRSRGPDPRGDTAAAADGRSFAAAPAAPAPVTIPALPLENGDSVVVDSILPPEGSLYVSVGGMVNKPGSYPWSQGMRVRDLVRLARGLSAAADLREAEIARLPEDRAAPDVAPYRCSEGHVPAPSPQRVFIERVPG